MSDNTLPFFIPVKIMAELTQENIDDIMTSALEGGINYWCSQVEVLEGADCEHVNEHISRGGTLRLTECEDGQEYDLTRDKFLDGVKLFFENGYDYCGCLVSGKIDPGNIDAECADSIVQLALFGELLYA